MPLHVFDWAWKTVFLVSHDLQFLLWPLNQNCQYVQVSLPGSGGLTTDTICILFESVLPRLYESAKLNPRRNLTVNECCVSGYWSKWVIETLIENENKCKLRFQWSGIFYYGIKACCEYPQNRRVCVCVCVIFLCLVILRKTLVTYSFVSVLVLILYLL